MKYLILGKGVTQKGVEEFMNKKNLKYDVLDINTPFQHSILLNYDKAIKSPGIPFSNAIVQEIISLRIPIISDLDLVYEYYPNHFKICITGTNGKTTTVSLLETLLRNKYDCRACGNIGIPVASACFQSDFLIIEASSFMLECSHLFTPNIFVLLNLSPAHLDHHRSKEEYFYEKIKLVKRMGHNDIVLYNKDDPYIEKLLPNTKARLYSISIQKEDADCFLKGNTIYFLGDSILELEDTYLKKRYLIYDYIFAILIAYFMNISSVEICEKLKSYQFYPFRNEKIATNVYNDSKSTNPKSTEAALQCLPFYSTILICGGFYRNETYEVLDAVLDRVVTVFLYGNLPVLEKYLKKHDLNYIVFPTLRDAIIASKINQNGRIILFSPMHASYDMFTSYYERGKYFNQIFFEKI